MKRLLKTTGAVLAAGAGAMVLASRRFDRLIRKDVDDLLAGAAPGGEGIVVREMLEDLPQPVRRYLEYTGVVGKPLVRTVHLKQQGRILVDAAGSWVPLRAEQWYTAQTPGFVWAARAGVGPLPLIRARDMYLDCRGHMLIRAGAIFTIADALGPEIDQGALMRYLSEMVWFPAAFLGGNVSFQEIDDTSARVTLTDRGRSVSGIMCFDHEGRFTGFEGERYLLGKGGPELASWWTPAVEYGELAGLRLPVRAKAVWKLAGGDLEYIDITITELDYDVDTRERVLEAAA